MDKTNWVELKRLSSSEESWYKRRVYKSAEVEVICCATCNNNKEGLGKAMFEYSFLSAEAGPYAHLGELLRTAELDTGTILTLMEWTESGWDGNTYCNRGCLPKALLRRYNRSNRKSATPNYGKKRELQKVKSSERLSRLVSRYEGLGCIRGSATVIAIEEGISRQRVHKLLENWYGPGQVPCLNAAAIAAKAAR